jgi:hypothetical protein
MAGIFEARSVHGTSHYFRKRNTTDLTSPLVMRGAQAIKTLAAAVLNCEMPQERDFTNREPPLRAIKSPISSS